MRKVHKTFLTTYQVSRYCEVYVSTVANWIRSGKLPAFRTPGGHHRIRSADVLAFMRTYGMPIPEDLTQGAAARILVVDDNEDFLDMFSQMVETINAQYKVVAAHTGFEAGKHLAQMLPDLVVLDLYMPGLDGFEVCKSIRADTRTKETKILAVTGDTSQETKERILSYGANGLLYKPITRDDMKQALSAMIEQDE